MGLSHDKWFYFKHGKKASTLEELRDVLEKLEEVEFRHHANNEKNDFANWIEHVFGETKLARDMREVSEREGMIILLDDFISRKKEEEQKAQEAEEEQPKEPFIPVPRPVPELYHIEPEENEEQPEPEAEHKEEDDVKKNEKHKKEHKEHKEHNEHAEHKEHEHQRLIIPEDQKISLEQEKELTETDIKKLVEEAMHVFEERHKEQDIVETSEKEEKEEPFEYDEEADDIELPRPKRKSVLPSEPVRQKFIFEEFIYGFVLGLIFGLIMLGILLNLRFG